MTNSSPAIVDVRQISKFFDSGASTVRALDDVSVAIRRNEFFTLLGPSGCGKTTLLRLIAGFEQPTRGEIFLDDAPIARLPPFERPVNTVFQSYALFPHLTIAQNIAFGLEMRKLGKAEIETTVRAMLELVHLPDVGSRKPAQLSGGQQQRIALARALANRPKVLLLDEPLSALDLKLRKEMQIELKRIQHETGITFVFVTHDQGEALAMSDRIAVIEQGRILQVGAPAEIYERPSHRFVADFIGETNFLPARIIGADRAALRDGHEVAVAPHQLAAGTEVTLAVRPERAALAAPGGNGAVAGTVRNVVYVGTDTLYHLDLPGVANEPFLIRTQNRGGAVRDFQVNDPVEVTVPADALQVLMD